MAAGLLFLLAPAAASKLWAAPIDLGRLTALPSIKVHNAVKFGIFGSLEVETENHRFGRNWQQVLSRVREERADYRRCDEAPLSCPPQLRAWRRIVASSRSRPPREQLQQVNETVNSMVKYAHDLTVYGGRDYWAAPLEFIKNRGDCEDYAILKFFTLLELGFRNEQLRVAVVRDRRQRALHAVVTAELAGKTYVLDSRYRDIVEHQHVLRYVPVFSANLDAQWSHTVNKQIRLRFVSDFQERLAGRTMEPPAALIPAVGRQTPMDDG